MDVAYGWAQRVAIFGERRIARLGPPDTVFDDPALLQRLRIRSPMLLDIAMALRARGVLTEDAPLPRSRAELLALLAH
jgi:cobalt/nickel transport system ATP-binding protein